MSLTVTSASTSFNLTTLARVKEELLLDQFDFSADTYLTAAIREASDMLAHETGRVFAKQSYKETVSGNNRNVLMLRRFPIVSLNSVVHYGTGCTTAGTTLSSASYTLQDQEIGTVYKRSGWLETFAFKSHQRYITVGIDPFPVGGLNTYEFNYTAGWTLPSTTSTAMRTLPYDLEKGALTLISAAYYGLGSDPMVKSEKIGDAMQTKFDVPYGVKVITGMPNSVFRLIEKYTITSV